jgi:TrmH family RNA methyltransferase
MANMGLSRLILVEPASTLGSAARAFAVGAGEILDRASRAPSFDEAIAPFARLVGTTSHRSRSLATPLISPRELPSRLATDPPDTEVALIFGPERSGLTTEELSRVSPLVSIPSSTVQPTLNLAQAVLIVAWELFLPLHPLPAEKIQDQPLATAGELAALFKQFEPLLATAGFARDDTFSSVLRDLRRLAARSPLTRREVQILRGICRRLRYSLDHRDTPNLT